MAFISRRNFLIQAGLGLASMAPFSSLVHAAMPAYRGATYLTPSYLAVRQGIDGFVKIATKQSRDHCRIDFFDSATLMKEDEQIAGLRDGQIHFMFHASTYITESFPVLGLLGLPTVCSQLIEHPERLALESPLWKLLNDELAKQGLFLLATGGLFEAEFIWSLDARIASLADLSGKRMRVVGAEAQETLKQWGVSNIRIPSAQTFLALQRRTVDAVLANIGTVLARNLHEALRYCYRLPATGFCMAIFFLKQTWDGLPGRTKAAFWEAAQWYDAHQALTFNTQVCPQEYWPMIKRFGIEVVSPTESDLRAFDAKSQQVWSWWKGKVGESVGQKALELALGRP